MSAEEAQTQKLIKEKARILFFQKGFFECNNPGNSRRSWR